MPTTSKRPSPALVIAILALFVALGGTAYAAAKIGTKDIKNNAITAAKIKKNAVTGPKIKNDAVNSNKMESDARNRPDCDRRDQRRQRDQCRQNAKARRTSTDTTPPA